LQAYKDRRNKKIHFFGYHFTTVTYQTSDDSPKDTLAYDLGLNLTRRIFSQYTLKKVEKNRDFPICLAQTDKNLAADNFLSIVKKIRPDRA